MGDPVATLAACIRSKHETITEAWRSRVTSDPEVPTGHLSARELDDHVPELVERVVTALEEFARWRDDAEARGELAGRGPSAAQHWRVRFREGYDLPQVLRELHHLREAIIDVCDSESVHVDVEGARIVHTTIDAAMILAARRATP